MDKVQEKKTVSVGMLLTSLVQGVSSLDTLMVIQNKCIAN